MRSGPRPVPALLAALGLLAGLALGCAEPPAPEPDPASTRSLPAGEVVGFLGGYGSHVWRGLPYALAPSGALRWRAPQPAATWAGTREALALAPVCPQLATPFGGIDDADPGTPIGDEDCLAVNVYAPRFAPDAVPTGDARLPVMVWIHGGGNVVGHAGFYDGGHLAAASNVIVVTLNYRLGPLGWFRHASLRADADAVDASGNYGTLDQILALRWVRENIAAFGGDPGNVTIFGESAGGRDVFALLLSPLAKGLFHRAIAQSGGLWENPLDEAEALSSDVGTGDDGPGHENSSGEILLRLALRRGLAPDRDRARVWLASQSAESLAALLRDVPPLELMELYRTEEMEGLIDVPQVFADGTVLPTGDALDALARRNGYNHVPVIAGTNRDENKLFLFADSRYVQRVLGFVPRVRDADLYHGVADALSAMWKVTGADDPARAMRTNNEHVYVYRFDWDEEPTILGADLGALLGAAHAFEIPFIFGHYDLGKAGNVIWSDENEPGRLALARQMASYWTQFAASGDPGRGRDGDLPQWTAWDERTPTSPRTLVLDTTADGGVRMTPDSLRLADVLSAVDADPRLADQRDRCEAFRALAQWGRAFDEEDYPSAGKRGCRQYAWDTFPWE